MTPRFEFVAPSQFEGDGRVVMADLLSSRRRGAMAIGTLVHAWFEKLNWLPEDMPAADALRREALRLGLQDVDREIGQFLQCLESDAALRVLNQARLREELERWLPELGAAGDSLSLEVCNEYAITYGSGHRIVSGLIDRLVLVWRSGKIVAAEIIDYKTDVVESTQQLESRTDYYAGQLQQYRKAIMSMLRLPPERVRARLLFTQADRLVDVE